MKYPKYLGSSVDPDKLSLTIKGILLGIIPFLAFMNGWFGIDFVSFTDEVTKLSVVIPTAITALWAAWSSVLAVWGVIRKIIVKFQELSR